MIWLVTFTWFNGIIVGWFLRRILVNARVLSQLRSEQAELERLSKEDTALAKKLDKARKKWRALIAAEQGLYDQLEEATQKRDVH